MNICRYSFDPLLDGGPRELCLAFQCPQPTVPRFHDQTYIKQQLNNEKKEQQQPKEGLGVPIRDKPNCQQALLLSHLNHVPCHGGGTVCMGSCRGKANQIAQMYPSLHRI